MKLADQYQHDTSMFYDSSIFSNVCVCACPLHRFSGDFLRGLGSYLSVPVLPVPLPYPSILYTSCPINLLLAFISLIISVFCYCSFEKNISWKISLFLGRLTDATCPGVPVSSLDVKSMPWSCFTLVWYLPSQCLTTTQVHRRRMREYGATSTLCVLLFTVGRIGLAALTHYRDIVGMLSHLSVSSCLFFQTFSAPVFG